MHWHASPRAAVGFLVHAATIDGAKVDPRRNLTMPGLAVTVAQQIEALRKVAAIRPRPSSAASRTHHCRYRRRLGAPLRNFAGWSSLQGRRQLRGYPHSHRRRTGR
jgi:hypothetical protein